MNSYPPEIQQWIDVIASLPGITAANVRPLPLDLINEASLTSESIHLHDLPRAALWRTAGGSANEVLVQTELRLAQDGAAVESLSVLATWIESLSRQGYAVQLRMTNPDDGTNRCLLELFLKTDPDDSARMIAAIEELTESLRSGLADPTCATE